ncbi:MAG: SulP family inorganic anion transporter [Dysgonomonas sp.]
MKLNYNIHNTFRPTILTSLKGYNREKFISDLMSGLIIGIVALPLSIAFAIASGVGPEKGIYASIIGGFIISLLGGSKYQIGGPTGAFIILSYNIVQQYGFEGLVITSVMAGIMLAVMGALKLGIVIKYIPYPIVVGYMSGMAVIIFSTQMKDFFGLQIENVPSDFIGKWSLYIQNLNTADLYTMAIGIISVFIIILMPKISKKIPGALIAVITMTIGVYLLKEHCGITSIQTIGDRFSFNGGLPSFQTVPFNTELISALFPSAFTLAILGSIESLLSLTVVDGATGEKSHMNTELIAEGTANIVAPFFGATPLSGAMARTMTNVNNGAKTPISGMIHSVFLLLVMLFFGDLAGLIPMSCLAAVLFVVSYNLSEWRSFVSLLKNSKADVVVLLTTFLLTIIFDITMAIEIGILLSIFLFMKRITESTQVNVSKNELDLTPDSAIPGQEDIVTLPKGVEVYEIDGPFFFGIANKFEESMRVVADKPLIRIIRMRKVPFMDSTGLHNLESLCSRAKKEGIAIILSGVRPSVKESLEKAKFTSLVDDENICPDINVALKRAGELIKERKTKI